MGIIARRRILRRIKENLQEKFAPAEVSNIGNIFIVSETNTDDDETFVQKVYKSHMEQPGWLYFDVISLSPQRFVGEYEERALILQETFGGTVQRTENRHIAEWTWQGNASVPLEKEEVIKALLDIV